MYFILIPWNNIEDEFVKLSDVISYGKQHRRAFRILLLTMLNSNEP